MLTPFSIALIEERRARVLQRVEAAQRVEVHRERHEPDRERLQRVGGDRRVVRGEPAAHEHAEHRLREHDEQRPTRAASSSEQVAQAERELVAQAGEVAGATRARRAPASSSS